MLNIKSDVMREELQQAFNKQESARQAIKTKEHSLNLLSAEKEDALERLRKVQRELQLITDFQEKEEQELTALRKESNSST